MCLKRFIGRQFIGRAPGDGPETGRVPQQGSYKGLLERVPEGCSWKQFVERVPRKGFSIGFLEGVGGGGGWVRVCPREGSWRWFFERLIGWMSVKAVSHSFSCYRGDKLTPYKDHNTTH